MISYIENYSESPFLVDAKNELCSLVFHDTTFCDTSLLKKYYLDYSECVFSDSIAKKTWKIICSSSIFNYNWYCQNFSGTQYDSIAKDFIKGLEFEIQDSNTVIFKKGFDYQNDYVMNRSSSLHILKEENGLFTTTGLSVIPYCNLADESKKSRDNPDNSFFSFTPIESAINMYWTFAKSVKSVSLFLGDHSFEFVPNSEDARISFKKEGVVVKNMTIVPSQFYKQ